MTLTEQWKKGELPSGTYWLISERKFINKDRGRTKKYYINKFNRKVRKIFLKFIKEYL